MSDINLTVNITADDAINSADELKGKIEDIFQSTSNKGVSTSFMSLQKQMASAYASADQIQTKLKQLQEAGPVNTKKYDEIIAEYNEIAERVKAAEQEVEKFNLAIQKYKERMSEQYKAKGMNVDPAQVKVPTTLGIPAMEAQQNLDKVKAELDAVRAKKEQLESSGKHIIDPADTEEYKRLTSNLGLANNAMSLLVRKASEAGAVPVPTNKWEVLSSVLTNVSHAVGTVASGLGSTLMSAASKAASAIGKLASNLAQIASTRIKNGISNLSKGLSGIGKSANKSNIDLNKAFKTLIKYTFGVRSFFFLYRKVRKAVVDGFGDLTHYSGDLNNKVSQVSTSLLYLRNAITTAFAPLVSYVAPILSTIIDKLAQATTAVGQFLAALLGQTSFVKAKKVYKDYAKSIEKSTKSSKKNAKELKRTIAGFDDVEILKDKDKDDSDSGSGGTNPWEDPNNMFEKVKVPEKFKKLADMLKDMWKNADFTELGRMLGEKLKNMLDNIPWDKIKEGARKIAKSIATFLNGFLEVPGLFTSIGKTLAEALNTAFEFLNEFAKQFHWDSLGKAIKDLILGMLNNIDWPLIYDTMKNWGTGIGTALETALDNPEIWTAIFNTIAKGLNAMLTGLDSFIRAIKWGSLAKNIATGLNNALDTFDWNLLGQTLVDAINGVFDFWYNFVTTFDFHKFGSHIGDTLSQILRDVDWKKGGASVAETINGLFDALNGFIEHTDWGKLAESVIDVIAGFFGKFKWDKVGKFLSNCLTALLKFLTSAVKKIKWEDVPDYIVKAVSDFLQGFDWKGVAEAVGSLIGAEFTAAVKIGSKLWNTMKDFGKNLIEGGYKGIIDKLASVANWIYDNIYTPFINAIKKAFGISSPSKVMEKIGKYIIEGLYNGTISKITNIINKMTDLKNKICGVFNKEKWKELGEKVTSKINNGIGNSKLLRDIKSSCSDIIDGIKDKFNFTKWANIGKNIVKGIGEGISDYWGWLTDKARDLAEAVFDAAKRALGIASPSKVFKNEVGKMIALGMAEGISGSADKAVDAVTSMSDNMVNAMATEIQLPDLVAGKVVPYALGKNDINDTNNTLNKVLEMLQYSRDNHVTKDELSAILIDMFTRYMNIDFHIGDEQLARHVNAGNVSLARRFSPNVG